MRVEEAGCVCCCHCGSFGPNRKKAKWPRGQIGFAFCLNTFYKRDAQSSGKTVPDSNKVGRNPNCLDCSQTTKWRTRFKMAANIWLLDVTINWMSWNKQAKELSSQKNILYLVIVNFHTLLIFNSELQFFLF